MAQSYEINRPRVVDEVIDGEAVIIHLLTGSYYCTNTTGALVWESLEKPADPRQLAEALAGAFGVDVDGVVAEVEQMVSRLSEEGLVRESDDPAPGPVAIPAQTAPYAAPSLEVFNDLNDLLLLDPVHDVDPAGWPHKPA